MKKWVRSVEAHVWTLAYIAFMVTLVVILTVVYHQH